MAKSIRKTLRLSEDLVKIAEKNMVERCLNTDAPTDFNHYLKILIREDEKRLHEELWGKPESG